MDKDLINKLLKGLKSNQNTSRNSRVLIIDSMNTFLRSFAMIQHLNPNGHHVGGLVGFLKSVGYAIKLYNPSRVILVFDGQGNSTNKKYLYPEYKANRTNLKITNWKTFDTKEDEIESMVNQMGRLIEYCKQLPVSIISVPKIEADDVIGYLVNYFEGDPENDKIHIMSADQDFLQLVSNKTEIYSPTKKKNYSTDDVINEYKVHPHNYIYYKVLMGDSGDNVPGINGLGEKKLFKYFPELLSPSLLSLDYIKNKSIDNRDTHVIYERVIEFEKQLDVNFQLMSLSIPNISDGDKADILNIINTPPPTLNIGNFMMMTENDQLNERINWVSWLTEIFQSLNWKK